MLPKREENNFFLKQNFRAETMGVPRLSYLAYQGLL